MNATTDPAYAKLTGILGPEKASEVFADSMKKAGLTDLATPDDRYRLGCELVRRGGLLEAIGRSIKIHAILQGAKET